MHEQNVSRAEREQQKLLHFTSDSPSMPGEEPKQETHSKSVKGIALAPPVHG